MSWLISLASGFSLLFALFHVLGARVFAKWLKQQELARPLEGDPPPVAILVASRGFDPSLPQMLRGLLEQDYPHYEIHVTVDESEGPARERLEQYVATHPQRHKLQLHSLGEPLTTCGLKNSALLVGLRKLSPEVARVAMIDTDIIPPPTWLADLTAYLDDPRVGAVSGVQWFDPTGFEPGTLVRSLWNAAALVPTSMFANAWAGSLAFRREAFERAGLPQLWERTIVDDGPLPEAMRSIGLRMKFARNMVMLNRESCSFGYVNNWLQRMLCWSKLYEASFRNTLVHALLTGLLLTLLTLALIGSIAAGSVQQFALVLAIWLGSNAFHVLAWAKVRQTVSDSSPTFASELPKQVKPAVWLGLWLFVPVTQAAFCLATLRVLTLKRIRWRGVEYQIDSPTDIKLVRRGQIAPNAGEAPASSI